MLFVIMMTMEHCRKPGLSAALVDAMCRLKETIDRGEVRTSVDQMLVLFDRAFQRNNGDMPWTPGISPSALAEC